MQNRSKSWWIGAIVLLCFSLLVVLGAAQAIAKQTRKTLTVADVETLTRKHADAWEKMDADAIVACFAPDAIIADIDVVPFRFENTGGVRKWVENSFKNFKKTTKVTEDMRFTRIYGDIAVSQAHYAFGMITNDGKEAVSDGWETEVVRMTPNGPKFAAFHAAGMSEAQVAELQKLRK